jgi:phosphate starvation-inducible PhoH-like protein
MAKVSRREKREKKLIAIKEFETVKAQNDPTMIDIHFTQPSNKPFECLTDKQELHKHSLLHDKITIAIGPAGTGKTYLSSCIAADLYKQGHFKTIIMTRPTVEVGKSLGYLPGELEEKYAPYLKPFKKGLIERLGSNKFIADFNRKIFAEPLQYMRGETYDNCIMLLDEAQNATITEMKMFLTRVGINSKIFISGDIGQSDLELKPGEVSGLDWFIWQIKAQNKPYEIIEYYKNDSVRSDLCLDMLDIIENEKHIPK